MDTRVPPAWLEGIAFDDVLVDDPDWCEADVWRASAVLSPPDCPCCVEPAAAPEPAAALDPEPVRWAVPGVWAEAAPSAAPLSPALAALTAAVALVVAQDPVSLAGAQSLADSDALLTLEQQLRRYKLRALADLRTRQL